MGKGGEVDFHPHAGGTSTLPRVRGEAAARRVDPAAARSTSGLNSFDDARMKGPSASALGPFVSGRLRTRQPAPPRPDRTPGLMAADSAESLTSRDSSAHAGRLDHGAVTGCERGAHHSGSST